MQLRIHTTHQGEDKILIGRPQHWRPFKDVEGWWQKYPLLAVYLTGMVAESSATHDVPDELLVSDEKASAAEEQLQDYSPRLVWDMGYYNLLPRDSELLAAEIAEEYA